LEQQLDEVRRIVGDDRPIWITEIGWPNCGRGAVTEEEQAAFLPRAYAIAFANGVDRVYWYAFKDDVAECTPGEVRSRNFGLLDVNNRETEAYDAYRLMTQQLGGRPYRDQDVAPAGVYSYRFGSDADPVRVMWTPDGTQTVSLRTDEPLEVVDAGGASRTLDPGTRAEVTLPLTDEVQYVHGPVTSVEPAA
jgi:hypothetical protein